MIEKKGRKEVFDLFCDSFDHKQFEVQSGLNPCIIKYKEKPYNIYIKLLTPAQLSNNNPDIWRCQLPKRPVFDVFKASNDLFILLGYDPVHDVYASWNPFWAKQRLNIGESVSMYSRMSIQEAAAKEDRFVKQELNHNNVVIVFPRLRLPEYLDRIYEFYPEFTEYIAIGSSLRKKNQTSTKMENAETLYSFFTDISKLTLFEKYLSRTKLIESTQRSYVSYIKFVHDNGYFEKYKSLFIKYDNIEDYSKAVEEFYNSEDISYIDRSEPGGWHGAIRAAIKYYYKAIKEEVMNLMETNDTSCSAEKCGVEENSCPQTKEIDNSIKGSELITENVISKIAPLMCKEEPEEMAAMQVLYEEFGDKYSGKMSFNDWFNLLRGTNWARLSGRSVGKPTLLGVELSNKSKVTLLKVTLTNGEVIFKKKSIDTYLETIERLYPDLIMEMGLSLRKAPLVSKERVNERQKEIKGGYFVSVCSHTKDLALQLQIVAQQLGEPIIIEIVEKESTSIGNGDQLQMIFYDYATNNNRIASDPSKIGDID